MKEKFYITTAIDYVNAPPHLGHAFEKVQADVIARYQRLLGKEVYFLMGTDEHGLKITQAAEEEGKGIRSFVNENTKKFKKLAKDLNLSNNYFIRTSDKKNHWPLAQEIWKTLQEKNDIYKSKYKGYYCVGCEAYITKKDLVNEKCPYHETKKLELIEEENYFFKLSGYADKVRKKIESDELEILPKTRKNEVLEMLKDARDVSCSRPTEKVRGWGVPVPEDNSQIMYVWVEALTNYLYPKKYWPADIHMIGKDILRFHAVIWPAMLMAVGKELPKKIFVHGFILSEGKRMSKTLGNVIDPFDLINEYNADALRYYLLREITPFEDGDFTEEKFKDAYNANLANGLGNYVSRVFKMALSYFNGVIKKPNSVLLSRVPLKEKEKETFTVPYVFEHKLWPEYKKYMEELKINMAADIVWSVLSDLDNYIQVYEPFKLIKTDKEKTEAILWSALNGLANISLMLAPFMPETAEKIMKGLGIKSLKKDWSDFSLKPAKSLFPRKD